MKQDSYIFKSVDGTVDIILTQGSSFFLSFTDNSATISNIDNVKAEIRDKFDSPIGVSFNVVISEDSIQLSLSPEVTKNLTPLNDFYSDIYIVKNRKKLPCYYYDVEVTLKDNTVYKPFRGLIFVNPEVTKI